VETICNYQKSFFDVRKLHFENSGDAEQRGEASNDNKTTSFQTHAVGLTANPRNQKGYGRGLTMSDRTTSRVWSISRSAFDD
jgi:hypothetical protein